MLRRTTVESKLKFLQVGANVFGAGRALVRAEQPAFQETDDPMHMRKQFHRPARILTDNLAHMDISPCGQLSDLFLRLLSYVFPDGSTATQHYAVLTPRSDDVFVRLSRDTDRDSARRPA